MQPSSTRLWGMEVLRGLQGITFGLGLILFHVHLFAMLIALLGLYVVRDSAVDAYILIDMQTLARFGRQARQQQQAITPPHAPA